MDNIPKCKYLHIFWHNEIKFNGKVVEMIMDHPEYFNKDDHTFITPHSFVFEKLKPIADGRIYLVHNGNLINDYGENADWLIVHSLDCRPKEFLKTKSKYAKKVVWRTWGHDCRNPQGFNGKKKIAVILFNLLSKRIIKKFRLIGISAPFIIDESKINKIYGNIQTSEFSYDYVEGVVETLDSIKRDVQKNNFCKIMVGHCALEADKHLYILDKLKKYKNENIKISIILSYGDKEYAKIVKENAINNFGDKVEFIEEFMDYNNFSKYISTVDIALFGNFNSAALNNIMLLSYFRKKIFFNPKGDLYKGVQKLGTSANSIDEIGNLSFNEFIKTDNNQLDIMEKEFGHIESPIEACEINKKFFDELKQ